MKNIEKNEIEKLLEIIKPAPLLRIGHFSDGGEILPACLDSFCREAGYEYLLNCTTESYFQTMQTEGKLSDTATIKFFSLERPNYMQHGKFYDYLFVSSQIAADTQVSFLKKAHRVIKNAGLILIFLPREERKTLDQWRRLLEERYFVATSDIVLDENWRVIISKKMHGWGG